MRRRSNLVGALTVLLAMVVMSAGARGTYTTGPGDPFVEVPDRLTIDLNAKVAYNGDDILWLFEWQAAGNW
jgi:hypothetical protein